MCPNLDGWLVEDHVTPTRYKKVSFVLDWPKIGPLLPQSKITRTLCKERDCSV